MRVVVVGAGLAGLSAAEHLARAGCDVHIVEGGTRPGGRARTVRDRFAAGQYIESGAEWVDTDHHRMLGLLARYGIGTLGEGQEWTVIRRMLHRNGVLLDTEQIHALHPGLQDELERYEDVFETIGDAITDPSRPELHPQAAFHDARSMQDIVVELGLDGLSELFARRNSQGEFAEELTAVSSLFVGQQRAQGRVEGKGATVRAHRVDGGLASVVEPFAGDVEAEIGRPIDYDELLTAVRWNADGVEVQTTRRVIVADRVVLACSLVPLRSVDFDPVLPAALASAIVDLGYGTVTKTALQYPTRFWPQGYANTTLGSQRIYEPTIDQPGTPGVLMAYTGGDGGRALARSGEIDRMSAVAADIDVMYAAPTAPLGGFSRAWSNEPRYGGAYAAYGPGQITAFWQALRTPCGPVHLAGEHTATWTGYLEGAVESGQRAAAAIIAAG